MIKKYLLVADCAIEFDNKLLVIERAAQCVNGGKLCFPGGKVEGQDENTAYDHDMLRFAARREVREEVGIDLTEPLRYITSVFFTGSQGYDIIAILFHCQLSKYRQPQASPREVAQALWMTRQQIENAENAPDWFKKYASQV